MDNEEELKIMKIKIERNTELKYAEFKMEFNWWVSDVITGLIPKEAFDIEIDNIRKYNKDIVSLMKKGIDKVDKAMEQKKEME